MEATIRLVLISLLFLINSCVITSHKDYVAHKYFSKFNNKIRTHGYYLSDFYKEQRGIFIFYENGFFFHEYFACKSIENCQKEVIKISSYATSLKNNWGGYWIEKDTILHMQYFSIMGAGTFIASRGVFNEMGIINENGKLKIIKPKKFSPQITPNPVKVLNFYKTDFKPDSMNWIIKKKWYKKDIEKIKKK